MSSYKGFYYGEYAKNDVYSKLSGNRTEGMMIAQNITDNIFDYFQGKSGLSYFSPAEKSHMKDVKFVISGLNFVYYSSAVLFLVIFFLLYIRFKKDLFKYIELTAKVLLYASVATFIFLVILFLMSVFYFNMTFTFMHLIFFPQGNWMFEASSLLITMFPEQFFFDITLRIFIYAMVQSIVFFIIGLWLTKQIKLHKKYHKSI